MTRARREAISLKGLTYQRVKDYCDANGMTTSAFLEELIGEKMDEAGVPVPAVLRPRPKMKTGRRSAEQIQAEAAKHFTF